MIVCQLLPSGFTFAQHTAEKALDEARERAKTWPICGRFRSTTAAQRPRYWPCTAIRS